MRRLFRYFRLHQLRAVPHARARGRADGGVAAGATVISNPKPGQRVQVLYAAKNLPMPHHGQTGTVEIVCRGRPRNHGVRIGSTIVVVPAGNLREPK